MIRVYDPKYGRVIIYEPYDIEGIADYPSGDTEELEQWEFELVHRKVHQNASVIGFRDIKTGFTKVVKNRYGPLEDFETEQFILNYGRVKKIIDPIISRFEILDL